MPTPASSVCCTWVFHPWGLDPETPDSAAQLEFWPAVVGPVSRRGAGLLLRPRFPPGTDLGLDLGAPARGPTRQLGIRVLHTRPRGDEWLHVCEFHEPLTESDLRAILGQAGTESGTRRTTE